MTATAPAQNYGIQETAELQDFLTTIANLADASLADGRVDTLELISFIQIVPQVRPAIEGLKLIPKELGDLSAEERAVLSARLSERLKLRNANVEILSEKGYALVLSFVEFFSELRRLRTGVAA